MERHPRPTTAALAVLLLALPATPCGGPLDTPVYDGHDTDRPRIAARLEVVTEGLRKPVDLAFPPGDDGAFVVVEQGGRLVRRDGSGRVAALSLRVAGLETGGNEQGLLGLAFHPDFATNGRFFLNTTETVGGGTATRVTDWTAGPGPKWWATAPSRGRVLLEVPQPYSNHNGGGLVFGPDGTLFVGLGDGGSAGDPQGNGQNPKTPLGKMLCLTVDGPQTGTYSVFATGLRNPWRYSFDPRGRLVVADVGQNRWEEIDLVPAGANLGWNVREGAHCHQPSIKCREAGLLEPIYEYDQQDGVSVTGGFVATGDAVPGLTGKYVFADFGTGRIWALDLPDTPGTRVSGAWALGRFGFSISAFGRDPAGNLYVADHGGGRILRLRGPE